jgi:hypothetical protein
MPPQKTIKTSRKTSKTAKTVKPAKAVKAPPPDELSADRPGPYQALADKAGVSERTMRKAMAREPITYQTASKIAKALSIPMFCFRCMEDMRGRNKG